MNITPINSITPTFNGKIIKKGFSCSQSIDNAFNQFADIKPLADSQDVVARLSSRKVYKTRDRNHFPGQTVYKLKFSFLKENSKLDKIKDFLGLIPRYSLTKHYHSECGLVNRFSKEYADRLENRIK